MKRIDARPVALEYIRALAAGHVELPNGPIRAGREHGRAGFIQNDLKWDICRRVRVYTCVCRHECAVMSVPACVRRRVCMQRQFHHKGHAMTHRKLVSHHPIAIPSSIPRRYPSNLRRSAPLSRSQARTKLSEEPEKMTARTFAPNGDAVPL